ncbi:hypothetical protein H5410_006639, partial [Solanum commersonii]
HAQLNLQGIVLSFCSPPPSVFPYLQIVMLFCLVIYDNVDGKVPYRDLRVAHIER